MIRKTFLLIFLAYNIVSCDNQKAQSRKQLYQIGDSDPNAETGIDWNQFEQDLKFVEFGDELPLGFGVFPVHEYNSSGNGNIEKYIRIGENNYVQQSVFVYQGDYNKAFFSDMSDSIQELVYFTILYKSDHQNPSNEVMASTRNHPVYLGQGVIKNDSIPDVKWVASQKYSGHNDFAIINMKYFDLSKGRLILSQSKSNVSMRFRQLPVNQVGLMELGQIIESQGLKWTKDLEAE